MRSSVRCTVCTLPLRPEDDGNSDGNCRIPSTQAPRIPVTYAVDSVAGYPNRKYHYPAMRLALRRASSMIHVDIGDPLFAAAVFSAAFCWCVTRSSIFARLAVGDFGLAMASNPMYVMLSWQV